jgi:hypothetical protein
MIIIVIVSTSNSSISSSSSSRFFEAVNLWGMNAVFVSTFGRIAC